MKIKIVLFFTLLALFGCASYNSKPLPDKPLWPQDISRLQLPDQISSTQIGIQHEFNPNNGLDVIEVATIAIANNPGLKQARDSAGVTKAQAFNAGLLPDPTLLIYPQPPINGGPGANSVASEYGLFYNISALITHSTVQHGVKSSEEKADLDLLWQEWLLLSQSQILFEKIITNESLLTLLLDKETLLKNIESAQHKALVEKDLDLNTIAVNTIVLKETTKQVIDLKRAIAQDRSALNQMLGLSPDTHLVLVDSLTLPHLSKQQINHQLQQLHHIRPDLLALQKGYEAQDYRLREAILGQFPAINFGYTRLRDNGAVIYNGFDLSVTLPIFNRNQGNVAIAQATRQQLYDEYQNRLNSSFSDVHQLTQDLDFLTNQMPVLLSSVDLLSQLSDSAHAAYQRQDMDLVAYGQFKINEIDKKIELVKTKQLWLEQAINLSMLIGEPLSNWVNK
ncbi:TolC family protein [Ferrovum sp. PN-J185]|uniref:TolC family protein n=1 Tax=Ferrovum sp. PN-J185 TaxID=1356306 RepID=UPI000793C3DE|nr:TolC family protein [Ferrovum sp. PN-J185]KXW56335.1 outer membrane efflux protein [Ferrovum sp. PN-J185]MCC6069059.1 TolC family protein [Ferrovum sp. PN-J185]MDE1890961.1 TolC family protein [Betaproteobacteria bacterium]MDE2055727.1 TolC family protein [Betaproteobacteria bacterium]